jgi:hypothetical protein
MTNDHEGGEKNHCNIIIHTKDKKWLGIGKS